MGPRCCTRASARALRWARCPHPSTPPWDPAAARGPRRELCAGRGAPTPRPHHGTPLLHAGLGASFALGEVPPPLDPTMGPRCCTRASARALRWARCPPPSTPPWAPAAARGPRRELCAGRGAPPPRPHHGPPLLHAGLGASFALGEVPPPL